MSKYADEKVLVISRSLFDEIGSFQGVSGDVTKYLPSFLNPANNHFLLRDLAEDDPSHKQIIPYAIFRHQDRYLHYVRGGASGEKRLAAKGSIGIGGHINSDDFEAASLDRDTYTTGVEREIDEELNVAGGHTQKIIGLLNDDSNEVGAVHLGVIHVFELESSEVTSNEDAITELQFLTLQELIERRDSLETWSQLLVDHLSQAS